MISCIEWIPRNVADPNPKRYELSKAEREFLAQQKDHDEDAEKEDINLDSESGNDDSDNDDDEEEMDCVQVPGEGKALTATEIIASRKIDPFSLPKDLKMDEYSDDEDNEDNNNTDEATNGDGLSSKSDIGDLLIGRGDSGTMGIDEDGQVEDIDFADGDSDDDDDDDLADVPDMREYTPTDIQGLEDMNFGGYNGINEFEQGEDDDDDSDVEDTNLKPDDALIIVAKTEEVSSSLLRITFIIEIICGCKNIYLHEYLLH